MLAEIAAARCVKYIIPEVGEVEDLRRGWGRLPQHRTKAPSLVKACVVMVHQSLLTNVSIAALVSPVPPKPATPVKLVGRVGVLLVY